MLRVQFDGIRCNYGVPYHRKLFQNIKHLANKDKYLNIRDASPRHYVSNFLQRFEKKFVLFYIISMELLDTSDSYELETRAMCKRITSKKSNKSNPWLDQQP